MARKFIYLWITIFMTISELALAPVFFGSGRRLFENLREPGPQFRIDNVLAGTAATHLRYVRQ